ncbi:MAG: chitobiase/beta-hexosaminidase C-terminal domain-containing protein [Prevotella sp.]|nr:chitobiase/beta-hexosaminidase C-terminal domain-containing protein [Prevotella sp.]
MVTTTTLWTFDQYGIGNTPFSDTNAHNYNGLYIRPGNASSDKITAASNANVNFNENKINTYTSYVISNGRETTSSYAAKLASGINTFQFGLNIGVPGTLYVQARVTASNKNFNIAFNGTRVLDETPTSISSFQTYSYTATLPGTLVFSGAGAYQIAAVKFVPTAASSPIKTITMPASGYITFSDIHAWDFTSCSGLHAYYSTGNITGVEANRKLTINEITSTKIIPACTGVILVGEPNTEYTMTMSDTDMLTLNAAYGLRPVISGISLSDTDTDNSNTFNHYALTKTESSLQFEKFAEGTTNLSANTAYYRIRTNQITDETKTPLFLQLTEMPSYTLTITEADQGDISVKIGDDTTTGTYFLKNTALTLTATVTDEEHYVFDYWEVNSVKDEVNTTNVLSLVMTANTTVEAVYKEVQNILTTSVSPEESGSIEVRISDATETTSETGFADGTTLKLTPVAATNYVFKEWQNGSAEKITDNVDENNVLTLTMNSDQTIKAVFELQQYSITNSTVNGTLKVVGEGDVETDFDANAKYDAGSTVTLKAYANTGYAFAYWMVDGVKDTENTTATLQLNMTVNRTVQAVFITTYGTYDFRTFASSALSAEGTATPELSGNVLTGSFTGDSPVTVTGSMSLNDVFEVDGSKKTTNVKLIKGSDNTATGLQVIRGSNSEIKLLIKGNGLKTGDWFKIETGDKELHFQKVNNDKYIRFYDLDDVSKAELGENGRYSKAISGKVYVATRDISSIELDFMKDGSNADEGPIYVHSIQISNGDAIPAPTIGSYDFESGKVDITVNNSLKGQTPTVYYTTDGTNPTTSSFVYDATNKISLTEASTIKAMAYIESVGQSTVAEKEVQLEIVSKANIGNLSEGSVTITAGTTNNTTSGVTVTTYYTLDGSTPTAEHNDGSFTEASKAVAIDQTRFVKAITISSSGKASEVLTKKIVVDAATPATIWDFTKMTSIAYSDDATTISYKGGSGSDFKYIVGSDIHAKMTWQQGEGTLAGDTDNKYLTGTKPFSINDLAVGDKIYITYEGGELKVFKNASKGNSITIGETEITGESEQTFGSGAEITVTDVDANDNYIAFRQQTATAKIKKIEINPVYTISNSGNGSEITGVSIVKVNGTEVTDKTFDDSFARGTTVTLKGTTSKTGGDFVWKDGDNVLTPAEGDGEGELTVTLTDNMTINVSYSTAKIWDFSEMSNGDITTVTESKGLYYRGGADTRKISIANNTSSLTWNFPDGFTYTSAPKNLTLKGNGGIELASALTPGSEADNKSNLTLAFTTTGAGTVYVAYRVASEKNAKLYFKSTSDESYEVVETNKGDDSNNKQGILYYTAKSAGNFFIGGDGDLNIYLVKFEPATTGIFTLTQTASPEGSGSVKKEIIYGDTPNYYETQANDFLAGTQLRLTPAANVGYGFSYWGDTNTDQAESKTVTMNADQSVKVNFEEVKHQVTVATAENGTVALQVGGETVTLTDGKAQIGEGAEITLLAKPELFYSMSDVIVAKTGETATTVEVTNGKFTLPAYDVTITPTFTEEKKYSAETAKTWTFTDAAETINSIVDCGDGLYLRGSASNQFTKVSSGTVSSVTFGDKNISVSNALQTTKTFTAPDAGNTSATAISPINGGSGLPMIAVNAETKGTIYVAASPVGEASGQIRIYFSNGTGAPDQKVNPAIQTTDQSYTTASYTSDAPGTFYIGTTCAANIYAVRFVPAVAYTITTPTSVANGTVVADKTSAEAGETVTLTITPKEGYMVDELTVKNGDTNIDVTTVTENAKYTFVMPAATPTITVSFKAIPSVYGTYDFRTWAESHISANDQSAIVLDASGVMTGEFTPSTTEVTIDGKMTLNDVFSIVGSKADNIASYKLRKAGTNGSTGSGILFPRCSTGQSDFIISNLKAGDWFTVSTATNHLVFAEANADVCPLGSETAIAASDELVPGRVYKVKDSAASLVSVKLCNSISGGGVSYIYSVTISNAEAISEPAISDLAEGKVTITGGSSTTGGSVKTYYTIDGSTPTASSTEYTSAIAIDQTRYVKAVTINNETNVVSNVVTKKIVVDALTPSTVWDFVNDESLKPLVYADETYNGCYVNSSGENKSDGKFKYITNSNIHSKLSWQLEGTETANASVGDNGLKITKGGRVFAINDLHEGDKIYITYTNTGETPLKTSICDNSRGCSISVNGGDEVTSGNTTEIASGDEIKIKSTPKGYEYLVLMPTGDNKITIQKIEINPSYTLTNATEDSNISAVKITKVNGETVSSETIEGSKVIARGTEVTLTAVYTAVEGKALIWQDGEGNEYPSNNDGTLTLTMDADKTVKALLNDGLTVTQIKDSENKEIARKVSNGLLEVTFNNNGRITNIKDLKTGKEVIQTSDSQMGYFNFNYRPSQTASVTDAGLVCTSSGSIVQVGKTGSDQVELIYPMADAATPSHQIWKIGYVMKKGVSGIYAYAILDGSSSYSELHEARFGWRVNPDIFNYAWVSDTQKGTMPTPAQMKNPMETVQDATFKLSDGTIYTKYDWANYVKDDQLHGIMGDGIGAWLISPSTEWVNGGPTKQELTVHATDTTPIILQTLHSSHFGAGEAVLTSSEDQKLFGPALFYVNSGTSQDAMVADAKQMVETEVAAWPYSWFTNNADIKSGVVSVASERGTVSGKVNVDERFGTQKVQVVLTQGSEKPLKDNNGYQYYTETEVGKNFEMKNVRPGTYKLYVYALDGGATGTYTKDNVEIATGANDLGEIEWATDGVKEILWRIGDADHTTKGFKLSDEKRHYGVWESVPETLTYTVGTSSESDWYYAQVKNDGTWNVKFNLAEAADAPLRLTIATAGASQTPKLEVKMNDNLLSGITFTNDAGIYRSSVTGGRDSLIVLEVPTTYLQQGENTLSLKVWNLGTKIGGVMYDCIKLESLEAEQKFWDFSEWTDVTSSAKKNLTVVTESNGLYYRAGAMTAEGKDARNINIVKYTSADLTWNFPDGWSYTAVKNTSNYAYLPGNSALAPAADLTPATKVGKELTNSDDSNNRTLAFTTYGAGTVYVAYRGTAEKDYSLYFKSAKDESYNIVAKSQVDASDNTKGILYFTAAEGGNFLIGGAAGINVYAVKFEPAETVYTLTAEVKPVSSGTIQQNIVYTVGTEEKTYTTTKFATAFLPNTKLILTAEAKGENTFMGWDNTTETGAKTITMTKDLTVVANFDKVTFSAIYLPEEMYQEQGEFTFNTTSPVTVWAAERTQAGTWEGKKYTDFQYLTNMDTNKVSVRVGAQSITYDEDNSIRLSRPMAFHNLDVDDEITILYAGAGSLASVTTTQGDAFTIDGTKAEAGMTIPSGALLKVTEVSDDDNYVVVGPASSSPIFIKGIYINKKAPEFLHTPTVELKAVEDDTVAVYTISYDEGATLHYQLSTEEQEQEAGTTGAYDLKIVKSAKMTAWTTKGELKSENLETTVFAPTPAPSVDGTFDFSEASEDLPADMEVTLDTKNTVVVEGETFYKPTILTAATFEDKFAFSETTASDKIKIRTNRQLVFARGTDMDMVLLNLKKGDVIAFDYSGGTMEFSASDIITTDQNSVSGSRRAVAANETVVSGENYVVTDDGNLILHLKLTTAAVSIAKMVLTKTAEPSAPKVLDFATTQEEGETLEEGKPVTIYYNGQDTSTRFFRMTNDSESLPAEGKISTPSGKAGLTTGGMKIDRNRFAIHDLAIGDTIKIRFSGGELTFDGHATKGDKINVKSTGVAIEPGTALESGVTIIVDKVDYLNNYLVFLLDKTCVISGIFINNKEVEKIIAPSIRDRENGKLVQITPGRSTMDREVFTCYTTDGTDPSMVNGISGLMSEVFDVELLELYDRDVTVKAVSYSRDGSISKIVEVVVQVVGVLTDISGVPTIDGKEVTIYDMNGRKVQTMTKGNIYIINGKKYLYK